MIHKYYTIIVLLLISLLFIQCKEPDVRSNKKSNESTMEQKQENIVGGWQSTKVTETIVDIANYVKELKKINSPIKEINNAYYQIVSGKNYRFEMVLENGENWMTQVYVNIKGEKSITTFKLINSN